MDAPVNRFGIMASKPIERLPVQFFSSLVSRVNQFIGEGYDVVNLGQGNPDLPTPSHIVRSLQQAAENPLNHKYPLFSGRRRLKEAICQWYQAEHGVHLDPDEEVAILPGTKTGLVELAIILLNQGDSALVPDPGYPDYWSGIALAGATMVPMPLLKEHSFLPDFEQIPSEQLKRAKLMFLNYPSNPTGACAPVSCFDDAIAFAEKNRIIIAHDFAYGAIGFDGKKQASFLTRPGAKEVGIEFYTLSKTYNMAGWRIGFALGNKRTAFSMKWVMSVGMPRFPKGRFSLGSLSHLDTPRNSSQTYFWKRFRWLWRQAVDLVNTVRDTCAWDFSQVKIAYEKLCNEFNHYLSLLKLIIIERGKLVWQRLYFVKQMKK